MFHTIHHHHNHDLEIAAKQGYEAKIDRLQSDLHKVCTPRQLALAESIADKFRKSLVFEYISAENSVFNLAVWRMDGRYGSYQVSFTLNGEDITIELHDVGVLIASRISPKDFLQRIKEAVCKAITNKITERITLQILELEG